MMCDGFICCKCEFMSFGFCKQLIQSFGDLNSTIDTMVRFTVRYKLYVILDHWPEMLDLTLKTFYNIQEMHLLALHYLKKKLTM